MDSAKYSACHEDWYSSHNPANEKTQGLAISVVMFRLWLLEVLGLSLFNWDTGEPGCTLLRGT
ncbi:hypothetical protein GCM10023116_33750 [Kistimonas scapharcae]|uniref:Uncharacterized protein n=1 Tax=Kistimonas scapharcae TaxID=1036133 RepID=A0ABP8V812_9GAMM